ncbi:MAG: hypothetical protein JXA92_00105, partial [candidate division Zixibacteria bacterium]|nr:hypothetical protein [candidate division Zixibacteria bacterium]
RERRRVEMEKLPDSLKAGNRMGMQTEGAPSFAVSRQAGASGQRPKDMGQVWYLDGDGCLQMEMLRTGMTDGVNTEVVRSRNLNEGMKIINGLETGSTSSTKTTNNQGGFRPPPPGF